MTLLQLITQYPSMFGILSIVYLFIAGWLVKLELQRRSDQKFYMKCEEENQLRFKDIKENINQLENDKKEMNHELRTVTDELKKAITDLMFVVGELKGASDIRK